MFRKKSTRVGNQLAISLAGHRIGTSLPRDVVLTIRDDLTRDGQKAPGCDKVHGWLSFGREIHIASARDAQGMMGIGTHRASARTRINDHDQR